MANEEETNQHGLPVMFKPLLWSFRWEDLDPKVDKADIILNTVNDGSLKHWRWLVRQYGKVEVKRVLETRLKTEVYPESRNLAAVIFGVTTFRHAR